MPDSCNVRAGNRKILLTESIDYLKRVVCARQNSLSVAVCQRSYSQKSAFEIPSFTKYFLDDSIVKPQNPSSQRTAHSALNATVYSSTWSRPARSIDLSRSMLTRGSSNVRWIWWYKRRGDRRSSDDSHRGCMVRCWTLGRLNFLLPAHSVDPWLGRGCKGIYESVINTLT
jgi:hypothetical protein